MIVPVADALLASALSAGEGLAARSTAHGLAFTLGQLGDIDLPEPAAARIGEARLRALATLYLSADLESAGILPAVEALAGLASTGAAAIDLGGAEPLLADWWRRRHDRVSAAERIAFFSRLFGTAHGPVAADAHRNVGFEDRMLELCEALYKLDEIPTGDPYGGTAQQARVHRAARDLAENLGEAGGGITAFMAGEIIASLRQAFAVIGHPDLRRAFAARDTWGVVAGIARIARVRFEPPAPYVRRGRAGMTVLAWLADVSDRLGGPGARLAAIGDPVVGSAIDWIEATLDIGAATQPAASVPPASPWSTVGA
ncbi:hypothetical protein [Amycolatopsis kentuckyensis]|uniref:hypothetical protein n=1 Tax=Amycolatopsis kentuckyensis TaxID=218823 RepID=UPI003564D913